MSTTQDESAGNSLYAALARTATRGIALYFSRPVRLFRPSKGMKYNARISIELTMVDRTLFPVSGWQTLKGLARHHGEALTPRYMSMLVREQGVCLSLKWDQFSCFPHHLRYTVYGDPKAFYPTNDGEHRFRVRTLVRLFGNL